MKILKPYQKTEMRFIKMIHTQNVMTDSKHLNVGGMDPDDDDDEETGELDAGVFRQGIWDED